ncbi:hypothetical protein Vadar_028241 [Vaccinium darrowii]|uniref:Uncharacterized protein n=1 Tax=Vaccinium darrowii TaxID=229202 RepID=A0ACB7YSA5_9ERIC|nr:hypothetical protein Vadar_028241 [Vaccinium darrowii]
MSFSSLPLLCIRVTITIAGDPILRRRRPRSAQAGGCRETSYWGSYSFHAIGWQIHHQSSIVVEDEWSRFCLLKMNHLSLLIGCAQWYLPRSLSTSSRWGWKESDFEN